MNSTGTPRHPQSDRGGLTIERMPDNQVIRRSALAARLGEDEIRLRQETGALRSVWRGAVHLGPAPDDELERYRLKIRGAVAVGGNGRVVSHESAAALHGIPLLRPDMTTVHFTSSKTGRTGDKIHIHRDNLPDEQVMSVDNVRVTTPARTVADVARLGTFEQAVCCLDSGLRSGITHAEIQAVVASSIKMKGIRQLRQALSMADARSESVGESFSRATMIAVGLPLPDLQVTILDGDGRFVARGDFGWDDKVTTARSSTRDSSARPRRKRWSTRSDVRTPSGERGGSSCGGRGRTSWTRITSVASSQVPSAMRDSSDVPAPEALLDPEVRYFQVAHLSMKQRFCMGPPAQRSPLHHPAADT